MKVTALFVFLGWGAVSSALAVGQSAPAELPATAPVVSCASLVGTPLSDIGGAGSQVLSAHTVQQDGRAVCDVSGRLAPTIGFEVRLPEAGWTQRYLQVGCGGLCGHISLMISAADGCAPLNTDAFVLASTDMGHQREEDFGNDPQKRIDFAHRGVHLTALAAKKLIQTFYGRPQAYAYFSGCSDGGREALMEAQRHPEDFNGIIAGAPALNFQVQNGIYHAWQARANQGPDGKAILTAKRLPLLHEAVLKACDSLDGQTDRLISEPLSCHFDPAVLQCSDGQAHDTCLSSAEVTAARRLYDGPRDPVSRARLTIGGPQPGSELAWAGVFVPNQADQSIFSEKIALEALQSVSFKNNPDAGFSLSQLKFDQAGFDKLRPMHPLYDATNPDLSAFAHAGGKLIIWHGWADPHISPLNSIAYHEALIRQMGQPATQAFERLYLLPGLHHCAGGEGPGQFDLLTAMLGWVEHGQAPEAILTLQVAETRPGARGFGAPPGAPPGPPGGLPPGFPPGPPPGAHQGPPPGFPPGPPPAGAPSMPPPSFAGPGHSAPPGMPPGPPPGMFGLPQDPKDRANIGRSRPVYPYPYVAKYTGEGDPREARNYRPAAPKTPYVTPVWMGSDFFRPYVFQ